MDYLRIFFSVFLWGAIFYMYFGWRTGPDRDEVGLTRFHDVYLSIITTWLMAFTGIKLYSPEIAKTNMFLMLDTLYSVASIVFVILFILKLRKYAKKKESEIISG